MASHIVRCPISCKGELLFEQHNVVNCERRMYQIKLAAVVAICLTPPSGIDERTLCSVYRNNR
jgi:hypothetical protein